MMPQPHPPRDSDLTRTGRPVLDAQRALIVHAFDALIDRTLEDPTQMLPGRSAQSLLHQLEVSGLAWIISGPDLSMTLFGITATFNGSAHGLLRAWQTAARERLALGVRK